MSATYEQTPSPQETQFAGVLQMGVQELRDYVETALQENPVFELSDPVSYTHLNAIMEHLREKVEQEGLTVIFITHDTELAAAWADKIYRLEDTALVEKSAEEVL